ncbi:radical SAM protein [Megalodesulfovibrio gigas]|uniref:Radical SAM domain protein n=1 Tax=Megalodesulfovibrio gigas (strain ATCC 19364 / DSM 1382 / NCIMB 9332 / VKM B-1759) TaxID=1121448 RepID=T2GGB7_MEGG1|nr:radical SAM protein [Megalodesulfovibrio gigas]AGW15256.1 Radical SAM domain protein [Megalodesulfovibrio gigas DSM 1382 = ATCC 19364]
MIQILVLDVVDACNLTCAACPRGRRAMKNTRHTMPYEEFRAILARATADGMREIKLYNWGEPFLHPDIARMVRAVKDAGLRAEISTNLSLKRMDSLLPTLEAGLDCLIVSISGVTQAMHGINHRGSRLETVFGHLERIAQARRAGRVQTTILLRYLHFPYNSGEVDQARRMARDWGFAFELLDAFGDPLAVEQDARDLDELPDAASPVAPAAPVEPAACRPDPGQVCAAVRHVAVVDAWGMVHLCCVKPSMAPYRLGRYLDLELPEIIRRMHAHPACCCCDWARVPATREERKILQGQTPSALDRVYSRRLQYGLQRLREIRRRHGLAGVVGLARRLAARVR